MDPRTGKPAPVAAGGATTDPTLDQEAEADLWRVTGGAATATRPQEETDRDPGPDPEIDHLRAGRASTIAAVVTTATTKTASGLAARDRGRPPVGRPPQDPTRTALIRTTAAGNAGSVAAKARRIARIGKKTRRRARRKRRAMRPKPMAPTAF